MAVQLRSGRELEKEKSEKDEGNKGEGSLEKIAVPEKERKEEQQQEEERRKKKIKERARTLCLQFHSRRDCKSQR